MRGDEWIDSVYLLLRDHQGRSLSHIDSKVVPGKPAPWKVTTTYPGTIRDSAKSSMGCGVNRSLKSTAECSIVNVGDLVKDDKGSRLSMTLQGVGVVIVLRTWESHVHGEGLQPVGMSEHKPDANVGEVL